MTGIYYPYLERAGKWEELRYSLRSLEKHLKADDYEVWIVGDKPAWLQGVHHIAHTKDERLYSASTYDAVMKLSAYVGHSDTPERFIRMYDDIYLIGDRTIADLEVTRYLYTYEESKQMLYLSGSVIWREQVKRTLAAVERATGREGDKARGREGDGATREIYMTETHCPEIFEKEKMRDILEYFAPAENRLLTSTLYYNVFPFERLLRDRKVERVLYYGHESEYSFGKLATKEIAGRFFLNHNDIGLTDDLRRLIAGMFPEKSRWEASPGPS